MRGLGFAREHLFNSPANAALTMATAVLIALVLWPAVRFLLIDAVWDGASRVDCLPQTRGHEVGACWPFIRAKFRQLMYGFYPQSEQWRVNLAYALGLILYELCTGIVPGGGGTLVELAKRRQEEDLPPLASLSGDVDPRLACVSADAQHLVGSHLRDEPERGHERPDDAADRRDRE